MPLPAWTSRSSRVLSALSLLRINQRSLSLLAWLLLAITAVPAAHADDCNAQFKGKLTVGGTNYSLMQGDLVSGTLAANASINIYNSSNVLVYSVQATTSVLADYVITTTGTYNIAASSGSSANITCSVPKVLTVTAASDMTAGVATNCTAGSTTDASCSLRDALAAATAYTTGSPAQSTNIQFASSLAGTNGATPFTITEAHGQLTLPSYVTINGLTTGSGPTLTNLVTVSGNNANRVFFANSSSSNIAINNLVITGGSANANTTPAFGHGGGLYLPSGYTTISQSTITGNSSTIAGGGVVIGGAGIPGTITQSAVYGNMSASAAGVDAVGTLTITGSTITGNTATGNGGGLVVEDGVTLYMYGTTISNNSAAAGGGAYLVFTSNGADLELYDSVIAGNAATGSYPDIDYGSSTFDDNGGNYYNVSSARTAVNPNLAYLGSYGGPTQSMPALPGGHASCAGDPSQEDNTVDQRGFTWTTTYGSTACTDAGSAQTHYSVAFTTQPAASYAPNVNFSPAPVASVEDNGYAIPATGNVVFTDANSVVTGTKTVALTASGAALNAAKGTVTSGDTLTAKYSPTLAGSTINFSVTSNSFNIAVPVALNHFAFTAAPPTSTNAGASFNVTVTAYSDSGTTVSTAYSGPVTFTSTDSAAVFPSTLTMSAGVGTFAITLKTSGSQTITVADSSGSPSLTSGGITVSAAAASTVNAATGSGQSAIITNAFANPLVVQTVDAYSNPAGGVVVNFSAPSSGASATLSAPSCTTSSSATPSGSCSVTATANSATGNYNVTASSGSLSSGTFSLTNNAKTSQTITFTQPGTQTFGTTPTLTATATSSLTVAFSSTTTSVCTITSGGAVTFVTAGTCSISADQAGNNTYAAATTVSRSFTVNAVAPGAPTIGSATGGNAQATVSFTAPANTGGASITGYTVTSSPGGLTAAGTSSPITVTGLTNGTPYTFTVTASNSVGAGVASAASNSVTPSGTQTITFNNPGTQTYGTTPTLTATASSGLTVSFTSSTTAVCTITTGGALTFAATGTCTINADQAGNSSYPAATRVTQGFTVQAASQTITFANPGTQTYGSTPTLTATASSGLTVTFSSTTSSVCAVTSSGALTFVSAGMCNISADQTGNSNYNAATTVSRSFTVNAAVPGAPAIGVATGGNAQAIVSFAAPTNTGGTTITGYTVTSSPGGITATGTASPITVTGLANGTPYTFTVVAANSFGSGTASSASNSVTPIGMQTITFINPGAQTYGTTPTLSASASSSLTVAFTSATPSVCSVSGAILTFASTGTCTVNADQAGNSAYSAATRVTQSFTVQAASQTITFVVASPITYSPSGIVSLSATGGASGNAVTFSVISGPGTVSGSTLTITGAGTIVVAADQAGNSNYNAAIEIQRSIVVQAATQAITFTQPTSPITFAPGATVALSATSTSGLSPVFSVISGPSTVSGTTLTITGAGTIVVAADQTGNNNYSAAAEVQKSIIVNTASQMITFAQPASPITYGSATTVALSATGGASSNAVTFSVAGGPGSISGTTLTITGAGTIVINADQAASNNYAAAATVQRSLVVSKASATLTGPGTQPVFVVYSQAGTVPASIAGQYSGAGITAPSGAITYSITNSSNSSVASGSLTIAGGAVSVPVTSTLAPGNYTVTLNYAGDSNYGAAPQIIASLQVGQIQPTITWATPSALTYGTTLGSVLNAQAFNGTSTVAGTYVYLNGPTAVASTTVLPAGSYMLTVNFTPTDTTTYKTATGTVALTVNKATPGISLVPSVNSLLVQNPVTLTATVSSTVSAPSGTVTFLDGTTSLGSATLTSGAAAITTSSLVVGLHSITAVYSGDANFVAVSSTATSVQVNDFNLTISTSSTTGSGISQTVLPGGQAVYNFTITPTGTTTFPAAVNLSVSGLPTGATYTISPNAIPSGAGATNVTLTINVPKQTAMLQRTEKLAPLALALLLLPFSGRMRRKANGLARLAAMLLLLLCGAVGMVTLTGCGSTTGFFAQAPQTYNVSITGTSGTLTHSTTVTLTVQ